MPDMGYIPQIPNFQLPGPAQITQQPGLAQGLASGVQAGGQLALNLQQARSLGIQNQAAPYMRQLLAQKQQADIQKQQAETVIGLVGMNAPLLKYLAPADQMNLLKSNFKQIKAAFPNAPIDPDVVSVEMADVMEKWATGRSKLLEDHNVTPDAILTYDTGWMGHMSEMQRDIVKQSQSMMPKPEITGTTGTNPVTMNPQSGAQSVVPNPPGVKAVLPTSMPATVYSQAQDTQRAAAGANAPLFNLQKSYSTAKAAFNKKSQVGDRTAIFEVGKVLNNGSPMSVQELDALATSGVLGDRFQAGISKILGTGTLSDQQRSDLLGILEDHMQGAQEASKAQTSMYPGVNPPVLPKTKTIDKQNYISRDGGKTWFRQ
jgi:hypothetical protein